MAPEQWGELKDLVLKEGKKDPRGNVAVSKGYSTQAQRGKGPPVLTQKGMSQAIEDIALPHLDYLTEHVAKKHFKPRGGEGRFADALRKNNYFEHVAVGVTRGSDIVPHLDRNNDSRTNYNIMAALTYTGEDEKGYFRVAILAYTRKCVGDYLENEGKGKKQA